MFISFLKNSEQQPIELAAEATALDLARLVHATSPDQAITCTINGTFSDLSSSLHEGDVVQLFDFSHPKAKEVFWHSSAHVLAQAVVALYPNAKPTIGPAIDNGFYYDFADLEISDADFKKIEEEAQRIIQLNIQPKRKVFASKEEALSFFENNPFKKELISDIATDDTSLTGYYQGDFFDLCRGPHLSYLGKIKAFHVMKTSGAYWKGDSKNQVLTRLYGISFPDKKLLKEYLEKLEEAKKRDHKILGPQLDLFSLKEEGPGMPFIHPKGMIIWNRLIDFWRDCHRAFGYVEIKTPSMMVKNLWEKSGHWANYRENMFTSTIEEREFAIKPMNCPGGMLYYKTHAHSYREFPLRIAEIGQVHRYEPSGSLSGLFRVRSFHQDDAHIFMRPEDIQDVILETLRLVDTLYEPFGFTYTFRLATRPAANTIGTDAEWEFSTSSLKKALDTLGRPYDIAEGDGAFYGPKIDISVFDALGRAWQCGTIQLDSALPERFDLEYTDHDGSRKRPIMTHRAIFGSIERFFGSLIEFYAGKFPLWLSPSQVAIIPVADRHIPYAQALAKEFYAERFEVHVDQSQESVSKKIRNAQLMQYNYLLTVGDQEVEKKNISVRTRDMVVHGQMEISYLLSQMKEERSKKMLVSPLTKNE
jgi:threonyl-tRNA synthetase